MNKFLIKATTRFLQYLLRKHTKKEHDKVKPKFPPVKSKIFISQSEDRERFNQWKLEAKEEELRNHLEK